MSRIKRTLVNEHRRMRYAIAFSILLPTIGVIGYMTIEGYAFLDALYMTINTIGTVGFREISPLSDAGKIFTIFLIIAGIGTFAYAISVITSQFLEGQITNLFKTYRTKNNLKKMKKHVIVVGYGRNGKQAAKELIDRKHPFIIIDQDHNVILANAHLSINFIQGDATEDQTLISAGVLHAKALITTLPNDADNLFVTLTARSLNKDLNIITRASIDSSEQKLLIAGANSVIMPEKVGGTHMATMVIQPDVVKFLEHLSLQEHNSTNLVEVTCNNLPDEYQNKTINEIEIRKLSGANIVGFKTAEGEFIINPSPETQIKPNSKLFVLGTSDQITKLKSIWDLDKKD